jgi:hypothetical protein
MDQYIELGHIYYRPRVGSRLVYSLGTSEKEDAHVVRVAARILEGGFFVSYEKARVGTRVRVREHHRIEHRRGAVGKVVGTYGGEKFAAVDVLFADGRRRLFWPEDLEEISSPQPWWRSLLGRSNAQ